jgi:hypothetical protein
LELSIGLFASDQPGQPLLLKRRVTKNIHVSVVLQSKLVWQLLKYLCIWGSLSKPTKSPIKHERRTSLPGQQILQPPNSTGVHRLHVLPCRSPSEFRLSGRKLYYLFLRPRNVCMPDDSQVPANLAPRFRLIAPGSVATHISNNSHPPLSNRTSFSGTGFKPFIVVILSEAKNGASATSDMDGQAAQVAASKLGNKRVQSLINLLQQRVKPSP